MVIPAETFKKIFVENSQLLTAEVFETIITIAERTQRPVEQMLMERASISPAQLLSLLSAYFEVPSTELRVRELNPAVVALIPENFAIEHTVVAYETEPGVIKVAMADPSQDDVMLQIENFTKLAVQPAVAREFAIKRALILYDGGIDEIVKRSFDKDLDEHNDHAAGELVVSLIEMAVMMEASDIHFEPFETEMVIRCRIDGRLQTLTTLPPESHTPIAVYLKIAGKLKIDQARLPQDGRFAMNVKGQDVNIRMSTVPSLWGEKIVLRLLPKESHQIDLTGIGLLPKDLAILKEYLKRPFGLILVCGPTGSGKSSTLYAALQEIGTDKIDTVNISTIEDPIEYTMARITQIQTQPDIDLTFANGLRALLRQDPDIIMVGEIRDVETADFSVRAALVGRLVLSSIHTTNAVGAIPRLLDMGVEPYLVSSTLSLVVAQRLARRLCTECRESYEPEDQVIQEMYDKHNLQAALRVLQHNEIIADANNIDHIRFFRAQGCDKCDHKGYRGRIGIFELLEINDDLRSSINAHDDVVRMQTIALEGGMKTMFQDGLSKVVLGEIDLDELVRIVYY